MRFSILHRAHFMMPRQQEIEVPLLAVLKKLGGRAKPTEIYSALTKQFPQLTPTELAEQLKSGGNKWTNRIQWVRQRLIEQGEMESPTYGVWGITPKGLERLR